MGQKVNKVFVEICKAQIACDGNNVLKGGDMCYTCKEKLKRRKAAADFAKSIEPQLMGLE